LTLIHVAFSSSRIESRVLHSPAHVHSDRLLRNKDMRSPAALVYEYGTRIRMRPGRNIGDWTKSEYLWVFYEDC